MLDASPSTLLVVLEFFMVHEIRGVGGIAPSVGILILHFFRDALKKPSAMQLFRRISADSIRFHLLRSCLMPTFLCTAVP